MSNGPQVDDKYGLLEKVRLVPSHGLARTQPVVYLIQEVAFPGLVKIGKSTLGQVQSRTGSIQTGNPRDLSLRGVLYAPRTSERWSLEYALHELFSSFRVRGEWFFPAPEMAAWGVGVFDGGSDLETVFRQGWELGEKVGYEAGRVSGEREAFSWVSLKLSHAVTDLHEMCEMGLRDCDAAEAA